MTMPSEPLTDGGERRLHPLSWLFVLLASLREFAVPLLAALIFGSRSESPWEMIGLIGGGLLAVHAVVTYFTYRYRIEGAELSIRSGVVQRQLRHIPFRRIHNVTVHQGLLHRLFGVAEVKLESAGGMTPEAHMRVLRLSDARAFEALVRRRGAASEQSDGQPAAPDPALLRLGIGELIRLGLISNRGMVVVVAVIGLAAQFGDGIGAMIRTVLAPVVAWPEGVPLTPLTIFFGAAILFVLALLALRPLSVVLAIVQYQGFTLRREDERVQVDGGLLTRVRANAPLRRIQAWHLRESLLHRWFRRRSLSVDTATSHAINEGRSLRELVPIAPPGRVDVLIDEFLPGSGWPGLCWQAVHPRAWRRMAKPPVFLTLAAGALAAPFAGVEALWLWLLIPFWLWRARKLAGCLGYAVGERLVAVRSGWLDRHWRFAEVAKLQGLTLSQSPFDRRHGMATLWLDSAGAGGNPVAPALSIPYLPEAEARRLLAELSRRLAVSRMAW